MNELSTLLEDFNIPSRIRNNLNNKSNLLWLVRNNENPNIDIIVKMLLEKIKTPVSHNTD